MENQKEPNLVDKARSLGTAVTDWVTQDKFSKVTDEQFQARKTICLSCPNWDNAGYNNTGKCKLCGCSVMKLYIPSAKCPDHPPRWQPISVSS
jgi:hypothetical protein